MAHACHTRHFRQRYALRATYAMLLLLDAAAAAAPAL